jgi:hypothetical protein
MFWKSFVYEVMWKNIVEPSRPQMITWRMRIPCCGCTKAPQYYVIPTLPVFFYSSKGWCEYNHDIKQNTVNSSVRTTHTTDISMYFLTWSWWRFHVTSHTLKYFVVKIRKTVTKYFVTRSVKMIQPLSISISRRFLNHGWHIRHIWTLACTQLKVCDWVNYLLVHNWTYS